VIAIRRRNNDWFDGALRQDVWKLEHRRFGASQRQSGNGAATHKVAAFDWLSHGFPHAKSLISIELVGWQY
jgi:hypothetical protein